MNMSDVNCWPVKPSQSMSLLFASNPFLTRFFRINSIGISLNPVPSPYNPSSTNSRPNAVSFNCAMVIRLGIAWGLIIISGLMPSLVNGISLSAIIFPMVPFCPHLLLNLSPIIGFLRARMRVLQNGQPSPFLSRIFLSIYDSSFVLYDLLWSSYLIS